MLPNHTSKRLFSKKWILSMVALLLAFSVLSACGSKKEGAGAATFTFPLCSSTQQVIRLTLSLLTKKAAKLLAANLTLSST